MVLVLKIICQVSGIADTLEGGVHEAGVAKVTEARGTRLDAHGTRLLRVLLLCLVLFLHLLHQRNHLLGPGIVLVTSCRQGRQKYK